MIDHIIYAAPDLDDTIERFAETYGVEAVPGGPHLGYGTRNALVGLGSKAYLEIMAIDPEQDVPATRRFFGLHDGFTPRYVAWCARSPRSLEESVALARGAGADLGESFEMSRRHPSGALMSWRLTSPFAGRDTVLPFYIDRGTGASPAESLTAALTLESLRLVHPDPERIRAVLGALGERDVTVEYGPAPELDPHLRPSR